MAGHCLHCGGTGFRNPSRERDKIERDAILLYVAKNSFIRWHETTEVDRERFRKRAVVVHQMMADNEGVV